MMLLPRLSLGLRGALYRTGAMRASIPAMRAYTQEAEAPAPAENAAAHAPKDAAQDAAPQTVSLDSAVEFSPLPGFSVEREASSMPQVRDVNRPHRLHVRSSRNNTIVTFTTPAGEPLANASGGMAGFRKAGRSGYEAGYRAALRVFNDIADNKARWRIGAIEVLWNGFGQGREAAFRAMMANEGEQVRSLVRVMTDKTPIKVGGVRPKKRRSAFVWELLTGSVVSLICRRVDQMSSVTVDIVFSEWKGFRTRAWANYIHLR